MEGLDRLVQLLPAPALLQLGAESLHRICSQHVDRCGPPATFQQFAFTSAGR